MTSALTDRKHKNIPHEFGSYFKLSQLKTAKQYSLLRRNTDLSHIASSAHINKPHGVFIDFTGRNLFFAESGAARIIMIDLQSGEMSTFAGSNNQGNVVGDIQASSAGFKNPFGVGGTTTGEIFVSDKDDATIRKIGTDGIVTTYAGTTESSRKTQNATKRIKSIAFIGDGGPATSAILNSPLLIACDSANNLYIADSSHNRVRKINAATQIISTIAGDGMVKQNNLENYFPNENSHTRAATATSVIRPFGVFVDSVGNVFITSRNRIQMVDTVQIILTIAGNSGATDNIAATSVKIQNPSGIWGDTAGNIYFCEQFTGLVRVISMASNTINVISDSRMHLNGALNFPIVSKGQNKSETLPSLIGIAADRNGRLFVSDSSASFGKSSIRRIYLSGTADNHLSATADNKLALDAHDTTQMTHKPAHQNMNKNIKLTTVDEIPVYQMYTIAGNGSPGNAPINVVATSAGINAPMGLAVDASGNYLWIAEYAPTGNRKFRKVVTSTGIMTLFAGDGSNGNSGNGGQATSASFFNPLGVCATTSGVVFVSDQNDNTVRKIGTDGIISVYVGTGAGSAAATAANGDGGLATSATMKGVAFIAADSVGSIYIADFFNNKVRKVDFSTQKISTFAGTGIGAATSAPVAGNGGFASAATLYLPFGVFPDSVGRVFISEYGGGRIRVVNTDNKIQIYAGGGADLSDSIAATSARTPSPVGIWGNSVGDIYYTSLWHLKARVITATANIVANIAGSGASSAGIFVPSGPALSISTLTPYGIAGDATGRLYVGDTSTTSVVRVLYKSTEAPTAVPSLVLTVVPSVVPSTAPSIKPTVTPTAVPSVLTSVVPTRIPTVLPSTQPSTAPTLPVFQMTTIAGNGVAGSANDGDWATIGSLNAPQGISLSFSGTDVIVPDGGNFRIRKVSIVTGITNVLAGDGTSGNAGDLGRATAAQFTSVQLYYD